MNPINELVPLFKTQALALDMIWSFGAEVDQVLNTVRELKKGKWMCHVEGNIQTNESYPDGKQNHTITMSIITLDDPASAPDTSRKKSGVETGQELTISAYNKGVELVQALLDDDDNDIMSLTGSNSFPVVKVQQMVTGYVFRLTFETVGSLC